MSVSTGTLLNPGEYGQKVESVRILKTFRTITKKWLNECEYRKIVESGRVPAKGGIRPNTEKRSGPVRKNGRMSVSTGTLLNPS